MCKISACLDFCLFILLTEMFDLVGFEVRSLYAFARCMCLYLLVCVCLCFFYYPCENRYVLDLQSEGMFAE